MGISTTSLVTISNALVRSSYTLSLSEKRLLMYAVSLLDKRATEPQMITITPKEYSTFFSLHEKGVQKTLKSAVENLWTRTLVIEERKYRWIITSGYKDGLVELEFHPRLIPQLVQLQNQFTQYFLHRAADFKLMYTWRIFELIMQFKRTGVLKIELDEFKEILSIPTSYNRDFGLIRSKVIKPSVNEIREKDGLKVTWKTVKKGRSVVALEFRFPVESQQELFKVDKAFIEKHARPGESYEQARERLKKRSGQK